MSNEVIVIGHKNPDLDSVASAIAFADFKNKTGEKGWIPKAAGKLDNETRFVFDKFKIKAPEIIENLKGKKVALMDHCTMCQIVNGIEDAEIVEVVDHHNIGDIETSKPIRFHNEPVGSTCTIIASYYFNHKIAVPEKIAQLLLAGIISDTDLFKSPTTTQLDLDIKKKLEKITGINSKMLGAEMFKVKSNFSSKTTTQIITEDFKEYDLPLGVKLACSQAKTMNNKEFLSERGDEILKVMKELSAKNNYDLFVVIITDLFKEGSDVFAIGRTDIFEKAMDAKLKNNHVYIPGLMSRKSQVIPKLIGLKE
ncbi:manganese-dependent inorganic pyrophosphatase [archaeon CG_4_10_14_0_2_um_filter_Archaea_38_6]|nr:MAG: manganese-dependent inorganic pyrophosphatase [archaeon CG07_land_8_20_14_0_80_38_8]PIU89560.1 MAG: manganese-dependent inorganic pyrophosphatase [archaeon CG06_land_8_20_14_3_00_37_11]PJA21922.1 MAG: manganese-dependent inorganic pyrophosphatase [archaeon CG_4_10_14_0_2_um_filter_Archaea_38_6]